MLDRLCASRPERHRALERRCDHARTDAARDRGARQRGATSPHGESRPRARGHERRVLQPHACCAARCASQGHAVAGPTDTSVIPPLYEREGAEFPRQLDGMFAIALWDAASTGWCWRAIAPERSRSSSRSLARRLGVRLRAGARSRCCLGLARSLGRGARALPLARLLRRLGLRVRRHPPAAARARADRSTRMASTSRATGGRGMRPRGPGVADGRGRAVARARRARARRGLARSG